MVLFSQCKTTVKEIQEQLALDKIGKKRTERKLYFPMSLTSSSSSRDRNKYGGIRFALQTKRITR